ncbi:MAG: hypothetical protein Q8S13_00295 [Dehalococcoidia bacterium]|nr:hypothetical protein [Dehalococcoidia bacterium]
MSGFETRFTAGDDAERIRKAFYGFVDAHADDVDGDACLRTEIGNTGQHLLVRLWSAEAMDAFIAVLAGVARPDRRRCYE